MRIEFFVAIGLGIAALIAADFRESVAEAAFLKNGVRPGNRENMNIIRRPSAGARKRIFAPGEHPGLKRSSGVQRSQRHAWFWKEFDPALTARGETRWATALATMADRRRKGQTLLPSDTLQTIASTYATEISKAAARHNVSEALLAAVIAVESRGAPTAVSPKGAQGLMQLMPATAKRFGVSDSFDATQNIRGGAAYLSWLLREFDGDVLLALAGYNAGEGAVRSHAGVPPYAETRDYVVLVLDALVAMQDVCLSEVTTPRTRCRLRLVGS